jgi:hypothetical protein
MSRLPLTAAVAVALSMFAGCGGGGKGGGEFASCTEGLVCVAANNCHQGTISCATGSPVCADTNLNVADGTSCGSGLVCIDGACGTPCTPDQACTSPNACKLAATTCASATASPVCTEGGNVNDGTDCGSGVVCRDGTCVPACQGSQTCQPPNPCTIGVTSCPTTASDPVCILTGNKDDGISCGQGLVCSGGSCVSITCQAGTPCQPSDLCMDGAVACSSPTAPGTCTTTTAKANGTSCGTGLACSAGHCIGPPSIASLTATPSNAPPSSSVTLTWSVSGADTLTLDPGDIPVTGTGTTVSPAQTTVYTLTAANVAGSTKQSVTLTVSTITKMWVYCGPNHLDSTVQAGGAIQFSSVFQVGSGSPGQEVDWAVDSSSLGSVSPSRGLTTTYTAPMTPGTYKVWGTSVWDPTKKDYCWVTVTGDTWVEMASMPTPRHWLGAAAVGDKIYAVGGAAYPNDSIALNTVEEYDPATNQWRPRASMPTPRYALAVTALNGRIYAIGGVSNGAFVPTVEVYDPTADAWTTAAPLPYQAWSLAAASASGKIFVLGGYACDRRVAVYDPAAGSWTTGSSFITGRDGLAAANLDERVYAVGGWCGGPLTTVEWHMEGSSYPPWVSQSYDYMPTARAYLVAATANERLYAIGGYTGQASILENVVEEFYYMRYPEWVERQAMPTPRERMAAASVKDVVYVIGGAAGGWHSTGKVEAYIPPQP